MEEADRAHCISVRVKLFATLARDYAAEPAGTPQDTLVATGSTIAELLDCLSIPRDDAKVVFVNGRPRSLDWRLGEGDEVGVFPSIGGG